MPNGYTDIPGHHRHRCYVCQFIWTHADTCRGDTKEHACPKCGTENSFKYFGEEGPTKKDDPTNA